MAMRFRDSGIAITAAVLSCSVAWGAASAVAPTHTIQVQFDTFDGPAHPFLGSVFPTPYAPIQTKTFEIPDGHTVVSATLSGVFGNNTAGSGTTARHELYLDNVLLGDTQDVSPDPFRTGFVPYSFPLSDLSVLDDEAVEFGYVQTTETNVRLGLSTLTIQTVVPEPASIALLGLGGLLCRRRRG